MWLTLLTITTLEGALGLGGGLYTVFRLGNLQGQAERRVRPLFTSLETGAPPKPQNSIGFRG